MNFLIKELGNESDYRLYVSQTESSGHEVLGGYTYNIKRDKNRSHFIANAVSSNNGAELNALDINEEAIYNWYNENDKLISTDKKLILNNFENKEYKLEVITKSDGYKDYKHITVNSPFKIVTISPNPAPNLIHVKYQIPKNTTNTYLSITNYLGFNVNTHLLTENSSNIKISTKGMVNGVYIIYLIHGGKVIDSKQLIKK
ncbi:T9SS type A sorting domain-containing protein [Psychroflexus gondwanensis]|uniref:T9SS type A sorting domain-containing protein n=1 Tax=Psychroflexus gondwanensis TaxID=251 RepID=UPI0003A78E90|nr:T9SS type A sorting domain-containing protein [Psychroflexus gondwanensis]